MLDIYLDAQLAGADLQQLYPALWQHLQTCADCAQEVALFQESLHALPLAQVSAQAAQEPAVSAPPALPRPASANESTQPLWRYRLRSLLLGEPFQVRFDFAPDLRLNLLTGQAAPAASAAGRMLRERASAYAQPFLLQAIPLEDGELTVAIAFLPEGENLDRGQLRVRVTAAQPDSALPPLRAELHWGDLQRSGDFDSHGEASLGLVDFAETRQAMAGPAQEFALILTQTGTP
jgi:hypothetical protein